MKLKSKTLIVLSLICSFASTISFSYALYKKSGSSTRFNVSLEAATVSYQITYNYPSNLDNGTFTSQNVNVDKNEVLINHAPNTNNISISNAGPSGKNNGTYTFEGWYTDAGYSTKLTSSTLVNSNQTVYAKYVCANTLHYYDGSNQVYTTSNASDINIEANQCEYGSRILGYSINPSDDVDNYAWQGGHTTISLGTVSGKYKIIKNGSTNWTVQRKLGLKVADLTYWSANETERYAFWCFESNNSESDSWSSVLTRSNANTVSPYVGFVYISCSYQKIIAARLSGTTAAWGWNQSGDISLYNKYSSSTPILQINGWDNWQGSWVGS